MPKIIRKYNEEQLQKAVEAVLKGMSKRKAAETFSVPRSTIVFRLINKSNKSKKINK
jgi:transposase